jgi:AcrR family transcriptional regulator
VTEQPTSDVTEQPTTGRVPRARRSDGLRTREAILEHAARLATVEGIEGLSLGRLADEVGISKSGLFAHFGSKEELQLATVETAGRIFDDVVVAPALAAPDGLARLTALTDGFLQHVEDGVFPGGCFFASVVAELAAHPGPVRDSALVVLANWDGLLEQALEHARDTGEIAADADVQQLAFEIGGSLLLANVQFVVLAEPLPLERARRAIASRLDAVRPA